MVPKAKVHHPSNLLNEWPRLDNAVVKLHIEVHAANAGGPAWLLLLLL